MFSTEVLLVFLLFLLPAVKADDDLAVSRVVRKIEKVSRCTYG